MPYRFSDAKQFSEGVAPAREVKPGKFWEELWGLIDKNGEWVLAPKYDYIHQFEAGWAFAAKNLSKWGSRWQFFYINTRGEELPFRR